MSIKKFIAEREKEPIREYFITIEPMFIGDKKDQRLERVMTIKKLDPKSQKFNEFQAIVPKKSRLDQEVDKILLALDKQING